MLFPCAGAAWHGAIKAIMPQRDHFMSHCGIFLFRLIVVSRIPDYRIGIILVHFVLIVIINIVEFEIFLIVAFRLNFHGKTSL